MNYRHIPGVCSWERSSAFGERAGLSGDAFLAWSHRSDKFSENWQRSISNDLEYLLHSRRHNIKQYISLDIMEYLSVQLQPLGMVNSGHRAHLTRWASRVGSVLFGTRTSCSIGIAKCWTGPLEKINRELFLGPTQVATRCHQQFLALPVTVCITSDLHHLSGCVSQQTWKCSVASMASLALVADKQKSDETNDCKKNEIQ